MTRSLQQAIEGMKTNIMLLCLAALLALIPACSDDARAARLARQKDLPALDGADKVVVRTELWAGAQEVTITDSADLTRLRAAMIVEETTPSAGETWATLTWLKGATVIRRMWVFDYGEWGFGRSVGHSPELVALIRKHLAATTK